MIYGEWKEFVEVTKKLSEEITEIVPWMKFCLGAIGFSSICASMVFLKFLFY